MSDSLLSRSTFMLISQVIRKLPSMPLTCTRGQYMARRAQRRAVTYLHGVREHPRQPEGDLLGVLLAVHRDLETVAEVYVENLARMS